MQNAKPKLVHHNFFAMNTDVDVEIPVHDTDTVEKTFSLLERSCSRFQSTSELSQFNQLQKGVPFLPSRHFYRIMQIAREIEKWSDGLITPRILPSLKTYGYSRSFEELEKSQQTMGHEQLSFAAVDPGQNWVEFDERMQAVIKRDQTEIDLGGIVKGWTVDYSFLRLKKRGTDNGMINAGGDLRVWGKEPWQIEIADPFDQEKNCCSLKASNIAVATSSIAKRSWGSGLHHIIDPRTVKPSDSDIVQATVAADSVLKAEILSKIWLILGVNEGQKWMEKKKISFPCVLILKNKTMITNNGRRDIQWESIS